MLAARDQENLVHSQHTAAAGKPLNQGIRGLQPKTPGNAFKTPLRARNDENRPLATGKAAQNAFVTPALRQRAPLGAKTTNAKAQSFKTPAPLQKPVNVERSIKIHSTGRRSAKSKIVIAPSEPVEAAVLDDQQEEDDEPDFGYAPPPEVPMEDPPIDLPYDQTFAHFQRENLVKVFREQHYASPKDENGMSLRAKHEQEMHRKALKLQEQALTKRIEAEDKMQIIDPDEAVAAMIVAGPKNNKIKTDVLESSVNTVKARSAAAALSESSRSLNVRLPAVAMRDTASSKQKKKPAFAVSKDSSFGNNSTQSVPLPVSKNTIGFPRAKKAPSILPGRQRVQSKPVSRKHQSQIDPREFVELYGEPPAESEMWFRLRGWTLEEGIPEGEENQLEDPLFDMDLNNGPFKLDGIDNVDDFQLPIPDE